MRAPTALPSKDKVRPRTRPDRPPSTAQPATGRPATVCINAAGNRQAAGNGQAGGKQAARSKQASNKAAKSPYVGVLAQDVEAAVPEAVTRGYLRVAYHRLGVPFRDLRSLGRVGRANPARHAALSSANGRAGYRPAPSACSAARMTV
jgi:hypothetical protein